MFIHDLIEVYKILHSQDKVPRGGNFLREKIYINVTRPHCLKFFKHRFNLDVATYRYSFGNTVVANWNHLPGDVIQAQGLNAFKGRVDKFLGHTGGLT